MKRKLGLLLSGPLRKILSPYMHIIKHYLRFEPSVGQVNFGSFRRLTPVSDSFGFNRGLPIDRYYIEKFLLQHSTDIYGRVLEIGSSQYTRQFGESIVIRSEVLCASMCDPHVTIVGDLANADHIPDDTFDCCIVTQTLQYIYGIRKAVETLYRILKPGGVLLATFPGITKICRYKDKPWSDFWHLTSRSATQLFEEIFPPSNLTMQSYGNVLVAISFLHGLSTQELTLEELEFFDRDYEIVITVRGVKSKDT